MFSTFMHVYSFIGNRGLCGKQIGVVCKDELQPPSIDSQPRTSGTWYSESTCHLMLLFLQQKVKL